MKFFIELDFGRTELGESDRRVNRVTNYINILKLPHSKNDLPFGFRLIFITVVNKILSFCLELQLPCLFLPHLSQVTVL